jgi:hypothetical protein
VRASAALLAVAATLAAFPPVAAGHGKNFRKVWKTQISPADRQWYRSTARCESGNDPWINTGNGYFGAVQWLPSTWQAAGGTGLPIHHGRHEQGVRGVRWMHRAGRGQWPVCG